MIQHQAITWNNVDLSLIGTVLGKTIFYDIWILNCQNICKMGFLGSNIKVDRA